MEFVDKGKIRIYNNTEFALLPVYDDLAPIVDFLDNGYLKVTLSGDFSNMFIELSKKQSKQIETAAKRKNAIVDKAIAMAMSKKMESDTDAQ